jgi:hypothetical protein
LSKGVGLIQQLRAIYWGALLYWDPHAVLLTPITGDHNVHVEVSQDDPFRAAAGCTSDRCAVSKQDEKIIANI